MARIRAWLVSIAFLTGSENFLSLCKADYYSKLILELLHQRVDGSPAPLGHFVTAYLQSARIWVEAVRDGKALELALAEEARWRHLWTTFTRPQQQVSSASSASPMKDTNSGADVPMEITKELDLLRKQNKQYQSERNAAVNKLKGPKQSDDGEEQPPMKKARRKVQLKAAKSWQQRKWQTQCTAPGWQYHELMRQSVVGAS